MYSAFMANANFRSLLADNLHPNTDGYTVMGQVWYQALSNIIH
jgi:lysophospholipase L1-like esterase